jgi:hypothetical protein
MSNNEQQDKDKQENNKKSEVKPTIDVRLSNLIN